MKHCVHCSGRNSIGWHDSFSFWVKQHHRPNGLAVLDMTRMIDRSEKCPSRGGSYYVNRISVPKPMQGDGVGTSLMEAACEAADELEAQLEIHPTENYGSDLNRLTDFFRRFGFISASDRPGDLMVRFPYGVANVCNQENGEPEPDTRFFMSEVHRTFYLGQRVTKTKGSSWTGRVVGVYMTGLTKEGYCVESENEPGSVQIYPVAALKACD